MRGDQEPTMSDPYDGYRVAFNGEKGRLTRSFGTRTAVPVPKLLAGHAGGDDRLRDSIFKKTDMPDDMRLPDSRAGAMSCLTGIAIRNSIDQKKPVRIADLVTL